ncbi:hypothetical protein ABC382_00750 [Lysinibacillus sp. 1P01SD]|uniref:hypothetical protein n=1 Tax=Lysinibacillus sp. 1P01SD TaxID=3132285 RepID=UPI0039A1101B
MYIEERRGYSMPFVNKIMSDYTNERSDYFRTFNNQVCSILAIAFVKNNAEYKKLDKVNALNFILEYEKFISSMNTYNDVASYFKNSTEEINRLFENSPIYINKTIPEDIQWTIEPHERQVTIALTEIKRIFNHCSTIINENVINILLTNSVKER